MEKYERNIKIKRVLTTLDTNNDGVDDTIAYLNQEDLYLPFLLKQSVKDLGVYTDYEEEDDVIDLGSFWDTNNDGFGDGGSNPVSSGSTNPYGDGVDSPETAVNGSNVTIYGCMDATDPNYNPNATVDDGSCLSSQDFDTNIEVGNNSSSGTGSSSSGGVAGCYRLNSGCGTDYGFYPNIPNSVFTAWATSSIAWCQGANNSYPNTNNCIPNGCGSQYQGPCGNNTTPCPCTPAPNTHQLPFNTTGASGPPWYLTFCEDNPGACYTPTVQERYNPNSVQCPCDNNNVNLPGIPDLIFNIQRTTVGCSNGEVNYSWQFFCMPV